MYYSISLEEEYLILILKYTKDILYSIFNQEIEEHSFGINYSYANDVYNNNNREYSYNDSIDFKYIVFALERGFDYTKMKEKDNDKSLYKAFFKESLSLRNVLWHSKTLSKYRIEKILRIWKQVYPKIKACYEDIDNNGLMKLALAKLDELVIKTKTQTIIEGNLITDEDIASDGSENNNEINDDDYDDSIEEDNENKVINDKGDNQEV